MELGEKLKKFEEACIEMANNDKQNLTKELNEKANNRIEKEVAIFKQKLENKLNKEKIRLEKDYNKKIIDLNFSAKKELLNEYNYEIDELFNCCKQKLIEFTNTEEYKKVLNNMFLEAMKNLEDKKDLTIYIVKNDKDKIDFSAYGKLEILEDSYIGGVKLQSKNILVDNTILTNLKEKIYGTKKSN